MRKPLINLVVKPILILLSSGIMGLVFGILPCYLFTLFGADLRDWCGYKSTPPHFFLQFGIGFSLASVIAAYVLYFRKR
jgi:hypothetical protein